MLKLWKNYILDLKDSQWKEYKLKQLKQKVDDFLINSKFEQILSAEHIDDQIIID